MRHYFDEGCQVHLVHPCLQRCLRYSYYFRLETHHIKVHWDHLLLKRYSAVIRIFLTPIAFDLDRMLFHLKAQQKHLLALVDFR